MTKLLHPRLKRLITYTVDRHGSRDGEGEKNDRGREERGKGWKELVMEWKARGGKGLKWVREGEDRGRKERIYWR